MAGRVAVVTGGASGIGLGVSRHLGMRGDRIAILDIDGDGAARAADEVRALDVEALALTTDVSDRSAVDLALKRIRDQWGPVTIMVTAAGISDFIPFEDVTQDSWDRMIAVNLTGTFNCLQAVLPGMAAGGWGRIITVASSAGQIGSPRQAHYSASKGGVISLTKTLAREYGGKGITVNTIPPFIVDTPMSRAARSAGAIPEEPELSARIPAGRLGTVDDIGAACAFLCSDEASYITGQVIGVNGGALV